MPIAPTPPIPAYGSRSALIELKLKGPKDTPKIKQFNKELKKVAKKYGATLKTTARSRRRKATRAKRKRA